MTFDQNDDREQSNTTMSCKFEDHDQYTQEHNFYTTSYGVTWMWKTIIYAIHGFIYTMTARLTFAGYTFYYDNAFNNRGTEHS